MSIQSTCRTCGHQFETRVVQVSGDVSGLTLAGNTEECPKCGGGADVRSGTYDFVDGILKAFTAPGMTREKIESLQDVIRRTEKGEISVAEAQDRAEKLNPGLSKIILQAQDRGVNWDRVIAVLALLHALWVQYTSDADVRAALEESQRQTEIAGQMLVALQAQSADSNEGRPREQTPPPTPRQTSEGGDDPD